MNSVQAAQKVWNGITNRRQCPTDAELEQMVKQVCRDEEFDLVRKCALRRLKGHVMVLRAIIAYEPTNEEDSIMKEEDIQSLTRRSFFEEDCFFEEEHIYP